MVNRKKAYFEKFPGEFYKVMSDLFVDAVFMELCMAIDFFMIISTLENVAFEVS